ncbi:MiaB/RimO family radical SAM methylthiotransferase [Frankia sp. CiP3]|uniref:MiaB/RimO family radical SAM methylthiotransferase n=1 Tax=Frankia sp. CiP3 TaxID=2880971 RepID=UPI001EF74684|nr:MiaB/RimO family radical SAM methylthiotransferase [Frankia sp. CiP3]
MPDRPARRVALITLGCSRNDVDSEELAARLGADGWSVVDDPAVADAVVVNTCGFVEAAKKDSIDTVLAAADLRDSADGPRAVVAVGCLAERYGRELAKSLPEADAVLGFDAYPALGAHLDAVLLGETPSAHIPRDRRTLLPITPVDRRQADRRSPAPGSASAVPRHRLAGGPVAPLKISSGCDRRCAFCAIPAFRGSHVSRLPQEVLAEAEWLAGQGVRELVLVSENSTSYGKDLGDLRALEKLLPQLAAIDGVVRVRAVYLQPAEIRPSLLETMLTTPGVAPYLDLSFQHASPSVLRRMRRFGGADAFSDLLARARAFAPELGARSNVILGFPGETRADVTILERFLVDADLDAVGVFGYSDEDGTEAANLPDKVAPATVRRRQQRVTDLVEQLTADRAERRISSVVDILVEEVADGVAHGRAAHQQPEVDGACTVALPAGPLRDLRVGDLVSAKVVATEGVDLITDFVDVVDAVSG